MQFTGSGSGTNDLPEAGRRLFDRCGSLPITPLPGHGKVPIDPGGGCICEDPNGNGRQDLAGVGRFFRPMQWNAGNEPVAGSRLNKNGRIDFTRIIALLREGSSFSAWQNRCAEFIIMSGVNKRASYPWSVDTKTRVEKSPHSTGRGRRRR